jgi:hypothetical protein
LKRLFVREIINNYLRAGTNLSNQLTRKVKPSDKNKHNKQGYKDKDKDIYLWKVRIYTHGNLFTIPVNNTQQVATLLRL